MNFNDMISFDSVKHQQNASDNYQPLEQNETNQTVVKDRSESEEDDTIFERCSQDHPDLHTYLKIFYILIDRLIRVKKT